jgi:hypothetical protein
MTPTKVQPYPRADPSVLPTANIPTSTVAAIGGGFISFAICVILVLTVVRLVRVYGDVRRRRARGENITFGRQWETEGGFWGFFTGLSGGDSMAVGAGGRGDEYRRRLAERASKIAEANRKKPEMWAVRVPVKGASVREGDGWLDEVSDFPFIWFQPIDPPCSLLTLPAAGRRCSRRQTYTVSYPRRLRLDPPSIAA